MTICMKCGARWETRDGSAEEEKYRMCWQCIEEAREKGEIPPKPEFDGTITSLFKNWFNGIVHDAECKKGHINMDISDCEDFTLTLKVFKDD